MYAFSKPFEEIVRLPHLLTFANDLHSGKLHREFHHGPDPGMIHCPRPPCLSPSIR